MMDAGEFGFTEIEHTADWALKVWAPDLPSLFSQAAVGMYWLMGVTLQPGPRVEREISLDSADAESLLVAFLSELLYLGDSEGLAFDAFILDITDARLTGALYGAPIAGRNKEIKAVTYHNLAIRRDDRRLEVTIVFDV